MHPDFHNENQLLNFTPCGRWVFLPPNSYPADLYPAIFSPVIWTL
jgi:hypothetical protein